MDSDDEFMSGLSDSQEEEDFRDQEDSDDGSLGDGTSPNISQKLTEFLCLMTHPQSQSLTMRTSRTWDFRMTKRS